MALPAKRPAPIRALVVDDEALARRNVALLLERDPDVGAITECASGQQAVELIRESGHQLVFLDVQMPECGGFDVLEMLGSELPPAIVFVTAYEEYALRAFEAGALDYLLKPFDDGRFARAMSRAKEKIARYAHEQPQPAKRLVIKGRSQVVFVNVADLDWIEAAGCYACLHVGGETHILRRALSELERDLGDGRFLRIHRSIIVNLDRVQGMELTKEGEYELILKTQARLRVSRRFRKEVQRQLGVLSRRAGARAADI